MSMLHLRHVEVLRYLKMSSPFNLFYQKSFLFGMQELMTPNETVLVLAYRERTPADRIYLEERVYHFEVFELDSTGGDKGMKINSTGEKDITNSEVQVILIHDKNDIANDN